MKRWAIATAVAALALYAVLLVNAAGQTLLALVLLAITALALWTYTSARTNALRYLFPGVAAALLFVVFPMLYTVGIGFTNYSSQNLLEHDAARAYLLDEATPVPDSERAFTLHAEGAAFRLRLQGAGGSALLTPPVSLVAPAPAAPLPLQPADGTTLAPALPLPQVVPHLDALRALKLAAPGGTVLALVNLREFAERQPLYAAQPDGALVDRLTKTVYRRDDTQGFYTAADGATLTPGYRVGVGLRHYATVFSEGRFREPFVSVFIWTVLFSGLTVLCTLAIGMVLAWTVAAMASRPGGATPGYP